MPWGDLFPQAPQGVQQGNEIDLGDVEDWLALDMRRVFAPNMGFSGCARTRVRRCRGSLGFDLRSSMSIRPLWPVGANIRP